MFGVEYEHDVKYLGNTVTVPLTWADGMVGVIPVFDNKEKAEKYSDDMKVIEIIVDVKKEEKINESN
jgi:hypothetical protein